MRLGVIAVAAALAIAAGPAAAADLAVTLQGVAHADGSVVLVLYSAPETFRKEELAARRTTQPATPGAVRIVWGDLAPGRYAVIAYHDENGNGTMDRFLGMIPTEGYGLSNNPEVAGPPRFDASAVELTGDTAIAIDLRY